jgi:hypothetical protein
MYWMRRVGCRVCGGKFVKLGGWWALLEDYFDVNPERTHDFGPCGGSLKLSRA